MSYLRYLAIAFYVLAALCAVGTFIAIENGPDYIAVFIASAVGLVWLGAVLHALERMIETLANLDENVYELMRRTAPPLYGGPKDEPMRPSA